MRLDTDNSMQGVSSVAAGVRRLAVAWSVLLCRILTVPGVSEKTSVSEPRPGAGAARETSSRVFPLVSMLSVLPEQHYPHHHQTPDWGQ